jgi:protein-S-isoprenylcysteine O-methyltransferase Ste14
MLCFSATFFVLWLLRDKHPTEWAKYPAIILLGIAVLLFVFGIGFEIIWPLLVVAAGILMIFVALRRNRQLQR